MLMGWSSLLTVQQVLLMSLLLEYGQLASLVTADEVFAVISSVLFLGDRMTPKLIVGGLLAISGVAMTQLRPSPRPV